MVLCPAAHVDAGEHETEKEIAALVRLKQQSPKTLVLRFMFTRNEDVAASWNLDVVGRAVARSRERPRLWP